MSKPFSAVPWSYTALTNFEQCPRKFYHLKVLKDVQETWGPEAGSGIEVHRALEQYGKGESALPEKYASYKPIVDKVIHATGQKLYEHKFGLTQDLQPTTFFGRDVWYRGALDVTVLKKDTAIVLDWKTGKRKQDMDQLKLFAGAALKLFPHVNTVKTGYVWLKEQKVDSTPFVRDDAPGIWQEFAIRVHRLEQAVEQCKFPPSPSGLCKAHCPVGKSRCDHCGTN